MNKLLRNCIVILLPCFMVSLAGCLSPGGQFQTGRDSFIEGDYHQAFRRLEPLAQQGNSEAQYAIGYMYFYGLGTIQDQQLATQWIQAAARQGQPQAKQALNEIHRGSGSNHALSIQRPGALQTRSRMPHRNYGGQSHSSGSAPPVNTGEDRQALKATWPKAKPKTTERPMPQFDFSDPAESAPTPTGPDVSDNLVSQPETKLAEIKPMTKPVTKAGTQDKKIVNKDGYVLQLAGTYDAERLDDYIVSHGLQGKAKKYRTTRNGEDWFILGYGNFTDKQAARNALRDLPPSLIQTNPWVRQMANLEQVEQGIG